MRKGDMLSRPHRSKAGRVRWRPSTPVDADPSGGPEELDVRG